MKMYQLVFVLLLQFFSFDVFALDIPNELVSLIETAEKDGAALFSADQKPQQTSDQEAFAAAKARLPNLCPYEYKPVLVKLGDKEFIYFLAQAPREGEVVFGRHFKLTSSSVVASTKSCLLVGTSPENTTTTGAYATHLLSSTPTEFHVYLSLKHKTPMYVGTSLGSWKIEAGHIAFIEKTPASSPENTSGMPRLSPNAPPDKPRAIDENLEKAIQPYIGKAKATYPQAKQRFLAKLPPKHIFFLTTKLTDVQGRYEQTFIAVTNIKDGVVTGRIANKVRVVEGYKFGDVYSFPETQLRDWTISKPDGTEEGNYVGKFLDTFQVK